MSRTTIRRCLLAAGICAALSAGDPANAQQAGQPVMNLGNAYAGVSAGVIIPQDLHLSLSGTTAGVAVSGSGNLSFDPGAAVTGYAGYHFNDYVAGELEVGYAEFDFDKVSGSITVSGLGTASGSISVGGHIDSVLGFANVIVNPMTSRSPWTPYFGGGPGFAHIDAKLSSIGGVAVAASGSETDLAADAIAGIDFAVAQNVSLAAQYRFLWVNVSSVASGGGLTAKNGDFFAHMITANATFHF